MLGRPSRHLPVGRHFRRLPLHRHPWWFQRRRESRALMLMTRLQYSYVQYCTVPGTVAVLECARTSRCSRNCSTVLQSTQYSTPYSPKLTCLRHIIIHPLLTLTRIVCGIRFFFPLIFHWRRRRLDLPGAPRTHLVFSADDFSSLLQHRFTPPRLLLLL